MTKQNQLTIRLNNSDNVVVARVDIAAGTDIAEEKIASRDAIAFGHKLAAGVIKSGEAVKKYGQIIGFAATDIQPGEHVQEQDRILRDAIIPGHPHIRIMNPGNDQIKGVQPV